MEIYPAHITESMRLQARILGFNVHFIPSGLTDKYQPFDRSIFGCMKSTARGECLKFFQGSPGRKITKEDAVKMLRAARDKLSVTVLESAWKVYEEDERSDGAPLQAPRAPRNSHPRSGRNSRSTTKQRVFTRYEGIAIAAVMGLTTKEKLFVGMRRIVQYARDYEKDPGCTRPRPMKKKAIKTLVDQRIFKATKDSYRLTKCGLAHAHDEKAQSKTDLHRETIS
jgi:hypothetical protein